MNVNELAANQRTALKMFWGAGYDTELLLAYANDTLKNIPQPSSGYWYAKDVSKAIDNMKANA